MVVLAAGSGSRVGAEVNKILLDVAGVPLIVHSLRAALNTPGVSRVVLVARPGEEPELSEAVTPHLAEREVSLVAGGDSRHASEWQALQVLASDIDAGRIDTVAIHDGARPLATPALFTATIDTAQRYGGAVPMVTISSVLRRDGGAAPSRLGAVQTPQAFRAAPLLAAYRQASADGFEGTDTASCLERYADVAIHAVPAPATNLKVTFAEDVATAEQLIRAGDAGSGSGQRPG